jgi:hypothetical protein
MEINYAIFAFKCSNPLGGMNDLYDTSDTLVGAINLAEDLLTNVEKQINLNYIPEIAQIMCLKTCKIVKKINLSDLICKATEFEPCYENQYVKPVRVRHVLHKSQTYLQNINNEFILYKVNDLECVEYSLCDNCQEIKLYSGFKVKNSMYICKDCN